MNRTRRPVPKKLQKKIEKEVHAAQGRYSAPDTDSYSDELTAKEMLKKYPKKAVKKKEEMLKSSLKKISIKKKKDLKKVSKRTTPGLLSSRDSSPAHIHPEGSRWLNTLVKQNQAQRTILDHKGAPGRRKK